MAQGEIEAQFWSSSGTAPSRGPAAHPLPPRRDEILGTTVRDFRQFGEVLAAVRDKGQVVAVTSGEPGAAAALRGGLAHCSHPWRRGRWRAMLGPSGGQPTLQPVPGLVCWRPAACAGLSSSMPLVLLPFPYSLSCPPPSACSRQAGGGARRAARLLCCGEEGCVRFGEPRLKSAPCGPGRTSFHHIITTSFITDIRFCQ